MLQNVAKKKGKSTGTVRTRTHKHRVTRHTTTTTLLTSACQSAKSVGGRQLVMPAGGRQELLDSVAVVDRRTLWKVSVTFWLMREQSNYTLDPSAMHVIWFLVVSAETQTASVVLNAFSYVRILNATKLNSQIVCEQLLSQIAALLSSIQTNWI